MLDKPTLIGLFKHTMNFFRFIATPSSPLNADLRMLEEVCIKLQISENDLAMSVVPSPNVSTTTTSHLTYHGQPP